MPTIEQWYIWKSVRCVYKWIERKMCKQYMNSLWFFCIWYSLSSVCSSAVDMKSKLKFSQESDESPEMRSSDRSWLCQILSDDWRSRHKTNTSTCKHQQKKWRSTADSVARHAIKTRNVYTNTVIFVMRLTVVFGLYNQINRRLPVCTLRAKVPPSLPQLQALSLLSPLSLLWVRRLPAWTLRAQVPPSLPQLQALFLQAPPSLLWVRRLLLWSLRARVRPSPRIALCMIRSDSDWSSEDGTINLAANGRVLAGFGCSEMPR